MPHTGFGQGSKGNGPAESAAQFAADSFVERPRRRSRLRDGGLAPLASGVPPEAIGDFREGGVVDAPLIGCY